jgi:phage tail sheath protein FI
MPEYLAPGVYVEEVDTGPKPIEGVSTSTSGMVGVTERGPEGIPTLVTSVSDFVRQFGGYLDDAVYTGSTWYLPHAVEGFFTNRGRRLYIVRVLPDSATFASTTLFDQGNTPDVPGGPTFTRFTRFLAAQVVQGDHLLLLDDNAGLPANRNFWALLQDDQASEYVQILSPPAGVVATATPIVANLWPSGTTVQGLDAAAAVLGTTRLIADVSQGEFLLPVEDMGILAGSVVYRLGNPANPASQESHAHADNGALPLRAPLFYNHNLNAPINEPTISVDPITARAFTAPPTVINTTIALGNRVGLVDATTPGSGQQLRMVNVTQGTTEDARILFVEGPRAVAEPDPGNVILGTLLGNAYNPGDTVEVTALRFFTTLPPNNTTIVLDNRVGLVNATGPGTGQQLRVNNVTQNTTEDVQIETIEAPRALTGPDPGNVILENPLGQAYNPGDTVEVTLLRSLTTVPPVNPTTIALDNRVGLVDATGPGTGQQLRITNVTQNTTEDIRIQTVVPPRTAAGPDPGNVMLENPLGQAYNAGDTVEVTILRPLTTVPPVNNATIILDNRMGLVDSTGPGTGQRLRITNTTTGDPPETVRVQTVVAPRAGQPDAGNVLLHANLTNPYNPGDVVQVELLDATLRTLTGDAQRGDTQVALDNRSAILNPAPPGNQVHFLQFTNRRRLTVVPPVNNTTIVLDNRMGLVDATGPGTGQQLRITNITQNTTEDVRIETVVAPRAGSGPDPGDVVLQTPLVNASNPGDTVEAMLVYGDVEFRRIATINMPRRPGADPGIITLEEPLQYNYPAGATVTLLRDTDADANTTFLAWDAEPNDRALVLGDSGAYGAGDFVRTEAIGAANAEYNQVQAGSTPVLRLTANPFNDSHPATTSALGRSPLLTVQAIDRGAWGESLRVIIDRENSPLLRETTPQPAPASSPNLTLNTTVGVEAGSILEFFTRTPSGAETVVFHQKVANVTGNVVGFGIGGLAQAVPANMRVRTIEFQMRIELVRTNPRTQREEVVDDEQFRQLSLDDRHSRYVVRVIGPIFINDTITPRRADRRTEGEARLIRVRDELHPNWPQSDAIAEAQVRAALRRSPDALRFRTRNGQLRPFGFLFTGGNDDIANVTPNTYIGSDGTNPPDSRTGIFALKNVDEISIVSVPGQTDQTVQEALINHCELMRYRFAVLDSRRGDGLEELQEHRGLYDSRYAAIYYPWLRINDPFPDNPRANPQSFIPPSGHLMGIYARNDIERGVHKAPANEVIRGINDLEFKLMKEEQDILNPRNINVLRNFRDNNRGLRVWGARTISSDSDWRYVNVRRLFIFIEHSIDRGTQWVVFEPNNEQLWQRVRRVVSNFLTSVWRDGALMGRTPEEAYYVKVDRTTMTQTDIDNGRLIIEVGIAPVKPAEFVIFRIGQWANGSEVEEG